MDDYLDIDMLKDIETKIYNLHNLFKSKFNVEETHLRNIVNGDILNSRVLFLNFPQNSDENIDYNEISIYISDNINICQRIGTNNNRYIAYANSGPYKFLYHKYLDRYNNEVNYTRYKMPTDFGIVNDVRPKVFSYQYIKIKDDELKLLEYNQKTWRNNEIVYLQDIDHIEEGINCVANFFYAPEGYQYKEWTTTGYDNIENSDYGLAQKPISKSDFNRWNKNIELLETAFDSFFNIWNVISYITWNKNSDFEWEELYGES